MICISAGSQSFKELSNLITNYHLVELRLDLLKITNEEYRIIFNRFHNLIVTLRSYSTSFDDDSKIIENAVNCEVEYIDVDLESTPHISKLLDKIQESNTKLIISYHNTQLTPEQFQIEKIIKDINSFHPDIIKLCFKANSIDDVIRTLNIYEMIDDKPLIAFNLGSIGKLSRLFALKLNAPFMYASESDSSKTEESQLTVNQLNQLLDLINR